MDSKRSRPGCFFWLVILAALGVCFWLTYIHSIGNGTATGKHLSLPFSLPSLKFNNPSQGKSMAQPAHVDTEKIGIVTGPPTLSAAFLNAILALAHSPASGTGQILYDLSQQYQIDDAYALAFFQHESDYGTTGIARFTRSLGNIRCSAGYICLDGYRYYTTWQQGEQDWYVLIRQLYVNQWHLTTVAQIVPIYAPASDGNDPTSYIAAVDNAVTVWRNGTVSP
jgi:hypothetical protein